MNRLFVLYDAECGFCSACRRWLERQPAYVALEFLPAQSTELARRFPGFEAKDAPEELVVISDEGGVYLGARAWIMCLYALEEYRGWSVRLAQPALLPLARAAFALLSKSRGWISLWLGLTGDARLSTILDEEGAREGGCAPSEGARCDPRRSDLASSLAQMRTRLGR